MSVYRSLKLTVSLKILEGKILLDSISVHLTFPSLNSFPTILKLNSSNLTCDVNFNVFDINTQLICEYELVIKRKTLKDEIEDINKLSDHWKYTSLAYCKFLKLEEFCNFTFIVKGKEFQVHKLVMSQASDVMRTMFTSNYYKEYRENSAKIDDIEPTVFGILISFIYGDRAKFDAAAKPELIYKIFEVAHKYNVELLEKYCIIRIIKEFTDRDNVFDAYSFAWRHDIEELKKFCWDIIQK